MSPRSLISPIRADIWKPHIEVSLSINQTVEGRDHENERKEAFIQEKTTNASYKCVFKTHTRHSKVGWLKSEVKAHRRLRQEDCRKFSLGCIESFRLPGL